MKPVHFVDAHRPGTREASIDRSNAQYAALARRYDALTPRLEPLRRDAHRLLQLANGDVVMDVGCGTGKSLPALSQAVSARGRVIAVEPCPEMMAQAKARADALNLRNIQFVQREVQSLGMDVTSGSVDAVLLMFTHDVLQSGPAITALLCAARPGARLALAGGKYFSGPLALLNPWVRQRQRPYCTTFLNYDAPWRTLFATTALTQTHCRARYGGIAYLAAATVAAETRPSTAA
jgi:demethylmenaquinone methyltransferase/2-methoxy-6-polyprenyl-1,4-benzoquinol methylase